MKPKCHTFASGLRPAHGVLLKSLRKAGPRSSATKTQESQPPSFNQSAQENQPTASHSKLLGSSTHGSNPPPPPQAPRKVGLRRPTQSTQEGRPTAFHSSALEGRPTASHSKGPGRPAHGVPLKGPRKAGPRRPTQNTQEGGPRRFNQALKKTGLRRHSKGSRRPAYSVSLTGPQPGVSCCKRAGRPVHDAYTKHSQKSGLRRPIQRAWKGGPWRQTSSYAEGQLLAQR